MTPAPNRLTFWIDDETVEPKCQSLKEGRNLTKWNTVVIADRQLLYSAWQMLAANEEFEITSNFKSAPKSHLTPSSTPTTWGTSSSNAESGIGSDDNLTELLRKRDRGKCEKIRISEDELLTPWNLVRQFELPQLVLVYNTKPSNRNNKLRNSDKYHRNGPENGDLNFSEPFLLYRKYESVKITARSLISLESGKLVQTGPEVIIPQHYSGWFSLLVEAKRPTPHCTLVSQLLTANVTRFLTGLRLLAYRLEQPPGGRSRYVPLTVPGGQTLRILAVFQEIRGIPLPVTEPGMRPVTEKRFVQCFTQSHQVVFVPMSAHGHFYTVAQKSSRSPAFVYSLGQLLTTFPLPCDVRLVSGPLPNKPPSFTGLLRLEAIKKSEVILACNVSEVDTPRMIEMDTHSGWCLRRIPAPDRKNKEQKKFHASYQRTLVTCRDRGDSWQKQIKASLPIFPDTHTKLVESALCDPARKEVKSDTPKRKFGLNFKIGSPVNIVRPLFTRNSFSKVDNSLTSDKHVVRSVQSMGPKQPDLIENMNKRFSLSRLSMSSGCDSDTSSVGHTSREKLKNLMKFRSRSEQPTKDGKTQNLDEGLLSPYGKVADALFYEDDEENIYAEISDFAELEMSYL